MRGRGFFDRISSVTLGALLAFQVTACKQEDVAPRMEKPPAGNEEAWDAPPQEKPEPPPPPDDSAAVNGGVDASGEPIKAAAASDANGALPPPPEGDEIPLGAPPLPEGVKGVTLKGTVIYPDYAGGIIQIDVSDKEVKNGHKGSQPKIIQLYRMAKPGPFELQVPENQGEVWLSAYNDADQNGRPSREEPRGFASENPYKVGTAELTGIEITLVREKIPPPPGPN